MAIYFARHSAHTAATTTFAAVQTGSDGSTAGPIRIPTTVKKITGITASVVVDGTHVTNTGIIGVLRLTGTNALVNGQQDMVIGMEHQDEGAGVLTYTDSQAIKPLHLDTSIDVISGSDLTVQFAYYGTDSGTQQVAVELEFQ